MGIISGLRRLLSRLNAERALDLGKHGQMLPDDRCSIAPGGLTRADLVEEKRFLAPAGLRHLNDQPVTVHSGSLHDSAIAPQNPNRARKAARQAGKGALTKKA